VPAYRVWVAVRSSQRPVMARVRRGGGGVEQHVRCVAVDVDVAGVAA
jgi:uncharacterized protein YcbK (DUF882 family)